ncbi:hypothetical protein [Bradyrhizobium sp. Leo121]|uniref:hypothetical protein n=1 Tax=Bradyrhizobium sp. Leo121 TaxID=1571195 RepID=UPI0010292D31|nr:hypothetical protein [Bradyrhizobium sp. Leo121]RZN21947.1 hypothetical protein CWO90_32550 [Bradyrhizobium sp. Leo121]
MRHFEFFYGFPGTAYDVRAMSEEEIKAYQIANLAKAQNVPLTQQNYLGMLNWNPNPKPLDERFADFKVRLAAALAKYPHLA